MPRVRKPVAISPISTDFTLQEKSKLLAALKSKGFHIISTPEQLTADLPGRSPAEIAALIAKYKVRKPVRSANVDHEAAVQPDSDPSPSEVWFRIVHNHMDCRCKRDDLSASLAEVIQSIGEAENTDHLSNVYAYLSECLAGKCPRELSLEECAIVVNLLEQVRSVAMDGTDGSPERSFLRGGSWWEKNGSEDQGDEDDESGVQSHSPSPLMQTASSSCSGSQSGGSVLQQFLTSCLSFPKIKRISRCLNPLLVPVSMLSQRQQQLLQQDQQTNNNQ